MNVETQKKIASRQVNQVSVTCITFSVQTLTEVTKLTL